MRKLVALVVIGLITSFILFGHRLVVNRTHSLPVGLYYWSDVPSRFTDRRAKGKAGRTPEKLAAGYPVLGFFYTEY
jgi:hypothetical protein